MWIMNYAIHYSKVIQVIFFEHTDLYKAPHWVIAGYSYFFTIHKEKIVVLKR